MPFPLYLKQFCNDLQIQLAKALKRAGGSCIIRGKLTISPKVEKYLQKYFNITKRFLQSSMLDALLLDQNIVKDNKDLDLSEIKNFKIKFGNDSVMQYKTRKTDSTTSDRSFKSSRIFHWEFERNINMAENRDKTAIDALNTRFEARTSEWRARIN
jgi:hypothetical protein